MLKIAAEFGTTDIVATPHSDLTYRFQHELVSDRLQNSARPRTVCGDSSGLRLSLECENIRDALACPAKYTING